MAIHHVFPAWILIVCYIFFALMVIPFLVYGVIMAIFTGKWPGGPRDSGPCQI